MDDRVVFLEPGRLIDHELELVLVQASQADRERDWAPYYEFDMRHAMLGHRMGRINLRVSNSDRILLYAGHIGYNVLPECRGHRFAARSCRLLFPLAKRHGLNPLWITCNPDNWPSRRTCELVGAEYVETVPLPKDNDMYRQGERLKCRYRVLL